MKKNIYSHLHGKRVYLTHGYHTGCTGIVVSTFYQGGGSYGRYVARIQLDEPPKTTLGVDSDDGCVLLDVSYVRER